MMDQYISHKGERVFVLIRKTINDGRLIPIRLDLPCRVEGSHLISRDLMVAYFDAYSGEAVSYNVDGTSYKATSDPFTVFHQNGRYWFIPTERFEDQLYRGFPVVNGGASLPPKERDKLVPRYSPAE